ncbi:hypothetical protein [Leucobacter musarum]|uniref:hypothetical protein n=1 Tax=Leucobacter musarum TaxID=1930747 RepID=UPI0006A7809E|nr:hypothetical protein [Leucobacter musarum]
MSRAALPLRVLGALSMGWPMPDEHDGIPVAWTSELAPGDNDNMDEPHYSVEPLADGDEVRLIFSERAVGVDAAFMSCPLRPSQVAALIEQWETLYAWPYNGELQIDSAERSS